MGLFRLVSSIRFWYYAIKASWRVGMGRWYVWRDAPTDVVRQMAVLWYHARHSEDKDSAEVIRQAHAEYKLRKRKPSEH